MDIFNGTLFYLVIYSAGVWCTLNAIRYSSKMFFQQWNIKYNLHNISETDTRKKRNSALLLMIFWIVLSIACFWIGIAYDWK